MFGQCAWGFFFMGDQSGDKRHTHGYDFVVKSFRWSQQKNDLIAAERGITFESVVVAIETGGLLDILAHRNPERYPAQRVLVVASDGYAYLVPLVEEDHYFFLKTIIPSRKATREYLKQGDRDAWD